MTFDKQSYEYHIDVRNELAEPTAPMPFEECPVTMAVSPHYDARAAPRRSGSATGIPRPVVYRPISHVPSVPPAASLRSR